MYFSHLGITFAVTIYNNLILLQFSRFSTSSCFRLLDPNAQNQYDVFLMSYANILYHWGYTNNSKLVLKFMTHLPEPHTGIGMITKAVAYVCLSSTWCCPSYEDCSVGCWSLHALWFICQCYFSKWYFTLGWYTFVRGTYQDIWLLGI